MMTSNQPSNDRESHSQRQVSDVDNADAQRAAIARELEAKLQGHDDTVKHIEKQSSDAEASSSKQPNVDSIGRNVDSAQQQSAHKASVQDTDASRTSYQPLSLGAQYATEQDLEADDIYSIGGDSALGSDAASVTTSLTESIYNYRLEHGRTYHAYKDGKYIFPNDEREADRLDLQHHLLRMTYGTGIWAVDFADHNPSCQVIGIDLSPGQPTLVPPNLKFIVDDAEDQWIYEDNFDFIHARLMAGCFSDWPRLLQQAYDHLEPGGWLELQDYGLPVKSFDDTHVGTDVQRWGELLCEASLKLGRPLGSDASERYEEWMKATGFVDIQQKMFMWPTNAWPKDKFMKTLGHWNQINIIDGLEGFCLALFTRGLGWTKTEVDVFVAKVTNDLRNRGIHAYFPMPVTFGRKPYPGEYVH